MEIIYKRIKCIIVCKKTHVLCAIATILTTILKIFQTLSSPCELSLMKNIGLDSISSYHSVGSWLDYRVCVCVCMCEMMSVCVVCVYVIVCAVMLRPRQDGDLQPKTRETGGATHNEPQ